MSIAEPIAPFAPAGEFACPTSLEPLTESRLWQRAAFFRPWYSGVKMVEIGSGEGFGAGYAALFAADVLGIETDPLAVAHARQRYPRARFEVANPASLDLTGADLILAFDAYDRTPDPASLLAALARCLGAVVLSTTASPEAFVEAVGRAFEGRRLRFLHQEARWPGLLREGLEKGAAATFAVVDGGPLPTWPRIGFAMPCCGEVEAAAVASTRLPMHYPGELEIALVAQGCDEAALARLRQESAAAPNVVHLIEKPKNLGYGLGANLGLAYLHGRGLDLIGVTNDDVIPAPDCLPQLVAAIQALQSAGHGIGLVGPMSNEVDGHQKATVKPYATIAEMHDRARSWGEERHSHVDGSPQVRGLLFLASPECLQAIGGFDPVFGLGNFEDDDLSLRARLSGFPLWVVPGAFLHHAGSSSFKRLDLDYEDGMIRNLALFLEKWDTESFADAMALSTFPEGRTAHVPLDAQPPRSAHFITINGAPVDLVHQASEFDLANWIVTVLRDKPREARTAVLDALAAA